MNILFDDGLSPDRRLMHHFNVPNDYDPNTEAFQFYTPVDEVWGDFETRDKQEEYLVNQDPNSGFSYNINNDDKEQQKIDVKNNFKERFYLKHQETETIDLAQYFPPEEKLFEDDSVIGLAFKIIKHEQFNAAYLPNRQKTSSFYLKLAIIIGDEFSDETKQNISKKNHKGIRVFTINELVLGGWNDFKSSKIIEGTGIDICGIYQTEFQISPILVLNKKAILRNRNYSGDWNRPPANWDSNIEFNAKEYWSLDSSVLPNPRMVIRIGRKNSQYILFLHGDKEANDPTGIPSGTQ